MPTQPQAGSLSVQQQASVRQPSEVSLQPPVDSWEVNKLGGISDADAGRWRSIYIKYSSLFPGFRELPKLAGESESGSDIPPPSAASLSAQSKDLAGSSAGEKRGKLLDRGPCRLWGSSQQGARSCWVVPSCNEISPTGRRDTVTLWWCVQVLCPGAHRGARQATRGGGSCPAVYLGVKPTAQGVTGNALLSSDSGAPAHVPVNYMTGL